MLYNATINVNPNEYPDEDAMVDDIMTNLEGYHPAISDSTDFPGMIDVVVTIEAKSPSEAMAKAMSLVDKVGVQVGFEVVPTDAWDKREGNVE